MGRGLKARWRDQMKKDMKYLVEENRTQTQGYTYQRAENIEEGLMKTQ
jgi:hypothetical protein